jgi:hypothetical protein
MKLKYTIILLSLTTPLAAETDCLQENNKTLFEVISCLDKRGIDLNVQRDKLYQAQIDHLQNRISYLETLIQLQQRQLDVLKQTVYIYQLPKSCRDIQQQDPTKVSGLYSIDVDGPQGEMPLNIYCNMDLHGGGWSLIYATNPKKDFKSAREVTPRSARHLPGQLVRTLAANATEILIINADNPSSFIRSVDDFPIKRLRALQNLNDPDELAGQAASAHWEGTERDRTAYWCKPSSDGYPAIYHACNNGYGLHLIHSKSQFNYSSSNHPMSVYLR